MSLLHHVTCITSDPQKNIDFYTKVIGFRLVKVTVNFDDPGTYHFYFGDYFGTPGSIFTTFPWPHAQKGRPGVGEVVVTYFKATSGYLKSFRERLNADHVPYEENEVFGEYCLSTKDHDGLILNFVELGDTQSESKIVGLHGVRLLLSENKNTISLLEDVFGFSVTDSSGSIVRLKSNDGVLDTIVDIKTDRHGSAGKMGPGVVHHVAIRVRNSEEQLIVREKLRARGIGVTKVIDRNYFTSIYFREPGGVLFEVATDLPGFTVDEDLAHLGERLCIPPQHKDREAHIRRDLPVIKFS